jgi:hypothetical protein
MKVKIDARWIIESDGVQYIIKEIKTVEEGVNAGKEYETLVGYFTSIHAMFNRLLKIKLMESEASNILELQLDILRIEQWFKDLFLVEIDSQKLAV